MEDEGLIELDGDEGDDGEEADDVREHASESDEEDEWRGETGARVLKWQCSGSCSLPYSSTRNPTGRC